MKNLAIWPLDWDAMLVVKSAVWPATQAIRNDAARPSPAGQIDKFSIYEPASTMTGISRS